MMRFFNKQRLVPMAIGASLAVVIYLGLSWIVVSQALKAEVTDFAYLPEEFSLTYEDVEFSPREDDSITLRGWWIPQENAIATVVYVHGLNKNRAERLPLLRDFLLNGFSVLTFDLRGHGKSDHVQIGGGFFEQDDVRGAIDFAIEEKGVESGKLFLMGKGLGAASALLGGLGESSLVGIYADSSFATLDQVIISGVANRTLLPKWFASSLQPGISLMASWTKGVDVGATRPIDAAAQFPFLLGTAHCIEDELVPVEDALRIRAVAEGGSWFNLFPNCEHARAYDAFTEQYTAIVVNYYLERLGLL